MRLGAILLGAALAGPWAVGAAATTDPEGEIAAASAQVSQAAQGLAAAEASPDMIVTLGRAITVYEAALAGLRAGVGAAAGREQALADDLAGRRLSIARLLATLETMSRSDRSAEGLHPEGPLAAARAEAMMTRLEPALAAEARTLAAELKALHAARDLHDRGEAELTAAAARLGEAQTRLSEALAKAAPEAIGPADPTLTMMARSSASLADLADALAAADPTPPPPEASTGPLAWPVTGTVTRHFNEPDASGVRQPGITLAALPDALVHAPVAAVVRYAGPFLEYGYVLVLEPDATTTLVLAGLAQVLVRPGATVQKGDLVGVLGGRAPDAEQTVIPPDVDTGVGGGETLYIEVRRERGPVDPEPLFPGENG